MSNALILSLLLFIPLLAQQPSNQADNRQAVRILILNPGGILSTGGPIQFDAIGIKYGPEPEVSGNDMVISGLRFTPSPEYFKMVERNLKEASAHDYIKITKGKLYYQNRVVNIGSNKITGFWNAIYWQGCILGFGATDKYPRKPSDIEFTKELIWFNIATLKGDSKQMCSKCQPGFLILTQYLTQ